MFDDESDWIGCNWASVARRRTESQVERSGSCKILSTVYPRRETHGERVDCSRATRADTRRRHSNRRNDAIFDSVFDSTVENERDDGFCKSGM